MDKLKEFKENLTPSNYFITKSMEIAKSQTSGTLWYLKKFLVLYDAIFLSDSIKFEKGVEKIIENFNQYIKSLPKIQQDDAIDFFFPKNIDLRGDVISYHKFAGDYIGLDERDSNVYKNKVNKYYFVYLMNIGGQSGVKAFIKNRMYSSDFKVSSLEDIIKEYYEINKEKVDDNKVIGIISDYHAALRNERQILYYYGYVHSRSSGVSDETEFSSLTPIGELAIRANYKEFILIWEHQKIKMISQPLTIRFPAIKKSEKCDVNKFKLNYSPYFTIIKFLMENKELNYKFYQYILSRTSNNCDDIIINSKKYFDDIDNIEKIIKNFGIKKDIGLEDFDKEIKKYILGIRNDLSKDRGLNYFSFLELSSGNLVVKDFNKLNKIYNIYEQIEKYKLKKYNDLFVESEIEIKNKYLSVYKDIEFNYNKKRKINWDLYIIGKNKIILLSLLILDYCLKFDVELNNVEMKKLKKYLFENFKNILVSINCHKSNKFNEEVINIISLLRSRKLSEVNLNEEIYSINKEEYPEYTSKDLLYQLKKVSKENALNTLERKRDYRVVGLLNNYYLKNYVDLNNMLICECCGSVTFKKQNGDPYIEYHHLIPFNIAEGPDHYENIFGICPNCHRKIHNGHEYLKDDLYKGFNKYNHFKRTIVERFENLYKEKIIKSYHLEYALSESIINDEEYGLILRL